MLFNVYVNSVLLRLQQLNYGCVIGSEFLGCIMYADDLLLICPIICGLKKMLNICVEEFSDLNLTLNVKKSCILRFGARYVHNCAEVQFTGGAIRFVDKAKYLGVMLKIGKKFGVDLQYMKSNFYRTFNCVFHRVAIFHNEIVIMQLVTSFCQPYLLYCTECLALTVTQIRSINHTWKCAMSHIFNISGPDVALVCDYTGNLYDQMMTRKDRFYTSLRSVNNAVISFLLTVV